MGQRAALIKQISATVQGSTGFSAISGDSVKKQKKKTYLMEIGLLCADWRTWQQDLCAGPRGILAPRRAMSSRIPYNLDPLAIAT